jgi:hypothetical protein
MIFVEAPGWKIPEKQGLHEVDEDIFCNVRQTLVVSSCQEHRQTMSVPTD